MLLLISIFSIIVISLVWARLKYFKIQTRTSRYSSMLYDPVVTSHILITYYYFLASPETTIAKVFMAFTLYLVSLMLFWWATKTAKQFDFAFSSNVGQIITNGPFGLIRHPFYASYVLCWFTSALLFNSILLWITLTYLILFYYMSAMKEEKAFLKSTHSKEYALYKKEIGMFLPRVTQWKSWFLGKSNPNTK